MEYPSAGHPAALTQELEEILVLTYGAIESTNVERWALAFGAAAAPVLPGTMRTSAYETDVVGTIHRLGQRYWERRGEAAMWERPFPTGIPGRPSAVDIALFNETEHTETRLEFGICNANARGEPNRYKLASDAQKLKDLATTTEPGFGIVKNYSILWHEYRGPRLAQTKARRVNVRRAFVDHASTVTTLATGYSVNLLMVSGGPLFSQIEDQHHWVAIGLFEVVVI